MRVWALLPLFASSGCLFLDDLNHAPTVSIAEGITSTNKGATLTVHADALDAEDGPRVPVEFFVAAPDGQALDPKCDYEGFRAGSDYSVTFYRPGIFAITAVASDAHHATASSSVMVTITEAKPMFSSDAAVKQTSTRDACNLNTAGDKITFAFSGTADDGNAGAHAQASGCAANDVVVYRWRISDYPAASHPVLTFYDGTSCADRAADSSDTLIADDTSKQVCLWTDPILVGATGMYSVVLEAVHASNPNGQALAAAPAGNVLVGPDQPPCITGTDPIAGSYVVDHTQLQEFKVDSAVDDRDFFGDGSIGFVWSVYRALDGTWREVPMWNLSTYQLDVSSYGIGEKLEVRVEALDSTGTRALDKMLCDVTSPDCPVTSCASSPNVCHKWKTWDLELR